MANKIRYEQLNLQLPGGGQILAADLNPTYEAGLLYRNGTRAMTAALSMGGFAITNLLDPVNPQDAATKAYVDAQALATANGFDVKASVRSATTAALTATYANGTGGFGATLTNSGTQAALVIDGVTQVVGNRVLVKNQGTNTQNGIYTVTTVGSGASNWVLTRAVDADSNAEVTSGMFTFVEEGTTYAATGWVLTTPNPITLGTTGLIFAQFSGNGAYSGSTTIYINGTTIQVKSSAVAGQTLISSGTTTTEPTWGTLGVVGGGTGFATATQYGVIYGNGTSALGVTAVGTTGQYLKSGNGSAAPSFAQINASEISNSGNTFVTSVAGTAGRISVSAAGAVYTVNIDTNYVGQGTITTLGTIGSGVWQGTVIGLAYGGTNKNLTAAAGAVVYTDADSMELTAVGVAGTSTAFQVLRSNGTGAPTWTDVATADTATTMVMRDANQRMFGRLTLTAGTATSGTAPLIFTSGTVLSTPVAGAMEFTTDSLFFTITTGTARKTILWTDFSNVTGTLLTSNGGTGLTTFTAGDMVYYASGTALTKLAIGGSGTFLKSNGSAPVWSALTSTDISTIFVDKEAYSGTSDTITLANTPVAGSEHVYWNGQLLNKGGTYAAPSNDYGITGNQIKLTFTPLATDVFQISYRK